MKILILGASGMIGSRIVTEAASRGHVVLAAARRPERIATRPHIEPLAAQANDPAGISVLAALADVMVSAVSPRGDGDPLDLARAVAVAVLSAAQTTRRRILIVGGAGSLLKADGDEVMAGLPDHLREPRAMKEVLKLAQASTADWTFFSPALEIAPGVRTGQFRVGGKELLVDAAGHSRISAEDFAVAMVDEIENPRHRGRQMTAAY